MVLNSIFVKTLLAGSLVVTSVGIAAVSGLIGGGEEKNLKVVAELIENVDVPNESVVPSSQPDTQTHSSSSSSQDTFTPKCDIYVVERPEGYGSGGEVRGRQGTYKVKKRPQGNDAIYNMFVEDCLDFYKRGGRKRSYVYYDGTKRKWIYSEDLQGKDGGFVVGSENRFENYRSFKD